MEKHYTTDKNAQIVLALLKAHGINKVIASPGTTNMALVASMQHDPYFEMYSSVDERSAAYMACGLAAESGEPVVITCTGATASRNYLSGLTEAYYRKLPILAITSTQEVSRVGHLVAQVIDRSVMPKDTVNLSVALQVVKDDEDRWNCEIKTNQAILELKRRGGGPVHINLSTCYSRSFDVKSLPKCRVIDRITLQDRFPDLPKGKVAVFVGAHRSWSDDETTALDRFCEAADAVVICDHTSGYRGRYRLPYALVASQQMFDVAANRPDLLIHIGEVSGDYYGIKVGGREVWRVSPDGEIRDTFRTLSHVFEMPERSFFEHYAGAGGGARSSYFSECRAKLAKVRSELPELPFSNIWLAGKMAHRIPEGSVVHFGILNSLRAWNFFELPESVSSASNVGGFGIDGGMSSLIGASLADRQRLCFCIIGDLAFFYDMNCLGNRHLGNNLRIMLVNNGKGIEFRQYGHLAAGFGDDADAYISAGGHFGNKSPELVKNYARNLGFEYLAASDKESFEDAYERFLTPKITDKPMVFEVFTDSTQESKALEQLMNIDDNPTLRAKKAAKRFGKKQMKLFRKVVK